MFTVKSAVLSAALVGHNALAVVAQGCYPTYVNGASYASGSRVSASTTTETQATENCAPPGTSTCPDSGIRPVTTTTTTIRNYQCVGNANSAFCGQGKYAPDMHGGVAAWMELGECSGTAPAAVATPGPSPALWSGAGCPEVFARGTDYSAGDLVTVAGMSFSTVYQCKPPHAAQWCGQTGYEPGTSAYWQQAWTALGSCMGTISPTSSPVNVALADAGGCPAAYSASETYEEGDRISRDGLVYQCKSFPQSLHCSQVGFEPGECIAEGTCYWTQAWTITGHCEGTVAPTTSPNYVSLQDMGGCPESWVSQVYEEGDRVSDGSLVYECKAWPFSGHCGQAGYEPNVNPATPGAWRVAWTLAGFCSGTIAPTTSPTFDALEDLGACPEEWSASGIDYQEGDRVAYSVSDSPPRKIVFQCREFPHSGFCNQGVAYEPTTRHAAMAWTAAGTCDGTAAPTGAPIAYSGTCTYRRCREAEVAGEQEEQCSDADVEAWSEGETYLTGDVVRVAVERFRCREWPNSLWCNVAAYRPETGPGIWRQAWAEDGACRTSGSGAGSPATASPVSPTGRPTAPPPPTPFNLVGNGPCVDAQGRAYDFLSTDNASATASPRGCFAFCTRLPNIERTLVGFSLAPGDCDCLYQDFDNPNGPAAVTPQFNAENDIGSFFFRNQGIGSPLVQSTSSNVECYSV